MKKFITAASLVALFAATPVSAADINGGGYTPDNYSAPANRSWTGLWIGAVGGYQFSNSTIDFNAKEVQGNEGKEVLPGETEKAFGLSVDGLGADGFFGELQLGYDQQIGDRFLIGVFGGLNKNTAEFTIDASSFNAWSTPQSNGATLLSFEQEWGGILGLRLGVLKSPDTLFYLGGGWAFGEMGEVRSDLKGGKPVFKDQETDLSGWALEAGMETRLRELGENASFKLSGRYTDYSAIMLDSGTGSCDGGDTCSGSLKLDHKDLTIMGGLVWKLNGGF